MTKIEWTDATWNPVTGCTKVSQGCKNCYAARVMGRFNPGRDFTDVRTHPERLDAPLHWKKPRRVFVNSMSDLFHEAVPDEFIDQVFAMMALSPQHTFQILTKRPGRMLQYMTYGGGFGRWGFIDGWARRFYEGEHNKPFPAGKILIGPLPHVWLGVSVEDQATADERIPLLLQTPAAVRFLSCEPLLGPIDLNRYFEYETDNNGPIYPGIDWVIAGGESGPKARPSHPDWFRSLRDQCAAAGVPFFFKQWGEWWEVGHELQEDGKAVEIDADSGEAEEWFQRGNKLIALDGRTFDAMAELPDDGTPCRLMTRLGKKAAGRLLDGREHSDYPA